jgi:hypothetical protein
MESINGRPTGHGTLHFERRAGITAKIRLPDQDWHTWRVEIDRRHGSFAQESIAWFLDGIGYNRVLQRL